MNIQRSEQVKIALGVVAFVTLFVTVSSFARTYHEALASFVHAGGVGSILAVVLLQALFTIFFVPLDSSVLVPLATHAWGPLATALISIVGWTVGSAVAFTIARRYGRPVVERMIGVERTGEAARRAPHENVFWWVVVTQALVEVDFVSYMFGLFTTIDLPRYALATALGDILPAFFFSYAGTLPVWYEGAAVTLGLAVTGLLFWRLTRTAR